MEPDEALSVALSEPAAATLGEAAASADDHGRRAARGLRREPEVTEGNSGTMPATFTVALERAPPAGTTVSVDYKVAGMTATVPGDVARAERDAEFARARRSKQVTAQVQGDNEDEGDEAFRLALSNLSGDRWPDRAAGGEPVATIVDDDDATSPPSAAAAGRRRRARSTTASGNPAGWSAQNVTVTLAATDNAGARA